MASTLWLQAIRPSAMNTGSQAGFRRRRARRDMRYHKGDYIIFVDQAMNRYIVETLEPQGPDSFFAWNFFDGILMQKEYFSSYVFEDLAAEYLRQHPDLKEQLEQRKKDLGLE